MKYDSRGSKGGGTRDLPCSLASSDSLLSGEPMALYLARTVLNFGGLGIYCGGVGWRVGPPVVVTATE